jgi:hypothetical protein
MSAWQLVDQTFRIALLVTVVAFTIMGTFEAISVVAEAAERDEIDD